MLERRDDDNTNSSSTGSTSNSAVIIYILIFVLVLILKFMVLFYCCFRSKRWHSRNQQEQQQTIAYAVDQNGQVVYILPPNVNPNVLGTQGQQFLDPATMTMSTTTTTTTAPVSSNLGGIYPPPPGSSSSTMIAYPPPAAGFGHASDKLPVYSESVELGNNNTLAAAGGNSNMGFTRWGAPHSPPEYSLPSAVGNATHQQQPQESPRFWGWRFARGQQQQQHQQQQ
jgi:hypothetical protein